MGVGVKHCHCFCSSWFYLFIFYFECPGFFAGFGDFEDFQLPEFTTKQTVQFCYNPKDIIKNKPSLSCSNGQRIELITDNVNQTVLNYSNLNPDCLEFTKSVRLFMLSRTKDICAGLSYCTVSIDSIEAYHSERVKPLCPEFGPSIFNQICFSVVYVCVNLKGVLKLI